jgi:hypothetical protein
MNEPPRVLSRREFLTGFMLSEAWRQPEDNEEGAQDPADILEKTEDKLNQLQETQL